MVFEWLAVVDGLGQLDTNVPRAKLVEKEFEENTEPSSQTKRRRMLQFESEFLDGALCSDEAFLRSKETQDSLEDALSEMPQWSAGFTGASAIDNEFLDLSCEGWIADCLNDTDIQFNTEDILVSGSSDVHIGITDLCSTPLEQNSNAIKKLLVNTRKNVVFFRVGWPPVRSYQKNILQQREPKPESDTRSGMFVKVSMDGAPYLRKIDLKFFKNYFDLFKALENMFKCTIGVYSEREGYNGFEFVRTYEDKDGDWMNMGDVPWDMFISSCKRLRIMKGSDAKGLGCL